MGTERKTVLAPQDRWLQWEDTRKPHATESQAQSQAPRSSREGMRECGSSLATKPSSRGAIPNAKC